MESNRKKSKLSTRILVFTLIVALLFVVLLGRVGYLQFVKGGELRRMALDQQTKESEINPRRGSILDRNGKELAISASVDTVAVDPKRIREAGNSEAVINTLSEVLGVEKNYVAKQLDKNSRFEYIKKRIDTSQSKILRSYISGEDENGNELPMQRGKTFIQIVDNDQPVVVLADQTIAGSVAPQEQRLTIGTSAAKSSKSTKPRATRTPRPTRTPEATATPEPVILPEQSATPELTATPEPTVLPEPTAVPEATIDPEPAATPEPDTSEPSEPGQAETEQAEPEQGEPDQDTPEQPEQSIPEPAEPEQNEPRETETEPDVPEQSAPDQSAAEQSAPAQPEPEQSAPASPEPEQTVSAQTEPTQAESAPPIQPIEDPLSSSESSETP